MNKERTEGLPTLFGGDVNSFVRDYGPRLEEALFRAENDPEHYETRATALQELEYMREAANAYGIDNEEFSQMLSSLPGFGGEFMDTAEGQEIYFGRTTFVFGEGQGTDALAFIKHIASQ